MRWKRNFSEKAEALNLCFWKQYRNENFPHILLRDYSPFSHVMLVRDSVAMLCARTPTFAPPEVDGDLDRDEPRDA